MFLILHAFVWFLIEHVINFMIILLYLVSYKYENIVYANIGHKYPPMRVHIFQAWKTGNYFDYSVHQTNTIKYYFKDCYRS